MNRSVAAAAALLLGLCAVLPSAAHAEEWRWCVAGDLLDSGRTNGPNLISRPFQADGAPDFQAQYETYVRSIMGPIEGEFILNCSPAFPDHDAAMRQSGEWSLSMHDMTGGLFEAKDVFWAPTYAASSATTANSPRSHDHATAHDSTTAASTQKGTATAAAASVETQRSAEPTSPSSQPQQEDPARAEQRRQDWERKRVAAQEGGASSDASAGAGAGAKPLRFVLWVGLRPQVGDTSNPACYSNIITRPGPPGWGAPGFVWTTTAAQARQSIDSAKAAFIAKCRATSGREIDGTIHFSWNQTERDESELANERPRPHDDVSVQMD